MTTITIERTILDRLIEAWDSTVLPTHRDGMMQERMEDLRAELAKPVERQLPDWHDAPTCAGLWTCQHIDYFSATIFNDYEVANFVEPVELENCRWYGPIPQDAAIAKAEGRKE